MKKLFLCAALLFCAGLSQAQTQQQTDLERHWKKSMEKVRVMSYNILNGFNWGKDTEREERLVEWVRRHDPEILGLQELCGFTQEKLEQLAQRWGHPYAIIIKKEGYPVGITSKRPITLKHKMLENAGHGMLHVTTYGFDVLVTHLNPTNTRRRHSESQHIADYIRTHQLDKCILMGDMNSHSPFDADYLEAHSVNLKANYGGAGSPNLLNGQLDFSVISNYLAIPLIDACRLYVAPDSRTSYPTPILMGQSKHKEVRARHAERLDYIFVSPSLRRQVVDGFIFNGEETDYLSDHYPVAIDLLIDNEPEK